MLKFLTHGRPRASSVEARDGNARARSNERGAAKGTVDPGLLVSATERFTNSLSAAGERPGLFPVPNERTSSNEPGASSNSGFPRVVNLNVGGKTYTTMLSTLRKDTGSKLYEMFTGTIPLHRDESGVYFLDRDGRVFYHILNWLRDGTIPIGLSRVDRLELLNETRYYRLASLHDMLGGIQQPHDHSQDEFTSDARTSAYHRNAPNDRRIFSDKEQKALIESFDFIPPLQYTRMYARLRYGHEYPGDWIVSSPRAIPDVDYDLYEATLGRDLIMAMNRMVRAGFKPCTVPPLLPKISQYHTDTWQLMMYKDIPAPGCLVGPEFPPVGSKMASSVTSRASTGAL